MIKGIKIAIWHPIFRIVTNVRKWYENTYIIPTYSEKRSIILKYKEKYNCITLVETGTFMGDTVECMKSNFRKIISIELSVELAEKAKQRFKNDAHVFILQGDSGDVLEQLDEIQEQPILYWLDGHYSGSFFIGDKLTNTALGSFHTPIKKELQSILKNGLKKNVILIDDARLFIGKDAYPTYLELVKYLTDLGVLPTQVSKQRDIIRIVAE